MGGSRVFYVLNLKQSPDDEWPSRGGGAGSVAARPAENNHNIPAHGLLRAWPGEYWQPVTWLRHPRIIFGTDLPFSVTLSALRFKKKALPNTSSLHKDLIFAHGRTTSGCLGDMCSLWVHGE